MKYHLGYRNVRKTSTGYEVEISLAANPSHLEAVDPVVEGKARARQRVLDDTGDRKKVMPILIHGDAAFVGQGVVAEVFNMSQLPGYRTGGTIHFIVNNQIGFTTLPADARSSEYCTDIAKMVEAPIFHVNGEDPDRGHGDGTRSPWSSGSEFGRDVVVDIYCYRRHGHNEGDEPAFTQPNIYEQIKNHPLPSEVFCHADRSGSGTISRRRCRRPQGGSAQGAERRALAGQSLPRREKAKAHEFAGSTAIFQPPYSHAPVNTAITKETLDMIAKALTHSAGGFPGPAEDQAHPP